MSEQIRKAFEATFQRDWEDPNQAGDRHVFTLGYRAALATKPQGGATGAERYEFLRNSEQRYQADGLHPVDGSVWVVRYSHPKGTIPELKSAGFGAELDANVDAAMRTAPKEPK